MKQRCFDSGVAFPCRGGAAADAILLPGKVGGLAGGADPVVFLDALEDLHAEPDILPRVPAPRARFEIVGVMRNTDRAEPSGPSVHFVAEFEGFNGELGILGSFFLGMSICRETRTTCTVLVVEKLLFHRGANILVDRPPVVLKASVCERLRIRDI